MNIVSNSVIEIQYLIEINMAYKVNEFTEHIMWMKDTNHTYEFVKYCIRFLHEFLTNEKII